MNHLLSYIFLGLLCLNGLAVNSQQQDSLHPAPKTEPIRQPATFKITQNTEVEELTVRSSNGLIRLRPNIAPGTRVNFSYRYISVGFSFASRFPEHKNNRLNKGPTKLKGLGGSFNFKHWQQSVNYSRTQGFYLENTGDYNPDWRPGAPYLQFPHFIYKQFLGATAYNFNPDFSVKAITSQTEQQSKSAGSFIPLFTYNYYISDDCSTPAPGNYTQKAKSLELLLGPGYYYTWVLHKKFYASLGFSTLAGIVFTKIETRSAQDKFESFQRNGAWRLDGNAGIGYNGRHFFAGAYLRALATRFRQQHTPVVNTNGRAMGHISVGYRFNAPGFIKRAVAYTDGKILELRNAVFKKNTPPLY